MKQLKIAIHESLAHYSPGGVGWYEGLQYLGHDPYILESQHSMNAYELPESPDLLVLMDMSPGIVEDAHIFKKDHPNTRIIVNFFGYKDYYLQLKDIVELWVEPVMKHDYMEEVFARNNLPLLLLPLGATRSTYHKTTTESDKLYDVSFVGGFGNRGHGHRDQDVYLYPVIDAGYKGFYGGFSYNGINYPNVSYAYLNTVYNQTKVNLSFHYDHQKRELDDREVHRLDFNSRVYEIALSNNFQISDHPEIVNAFEGTVPYVEKADWLNAIDYYLSKPDLRGELSSKAHEVCMRKHTWDIRMKEFLQKINLYEQD